MEVVTVIWKIVALEWGALTASLVVVETDALMRMPMYVTMSEVTSATTNQLANVGTTAPTNAATNPPLDMIQGFLWDNKLTKDSIYSSSIPTWLAMVRRKIQEWQRCPFCFIDENILTMIPMLLLMCFCSMPPSM